MSRFTIGPVTREAKLISPVFVTYSVDMVAAPFLSFFLSDLAIGEQCSSALGFLADTWFLARKSQNATIFATSEKRGTRMYWTAPQRSILVNQTPLSLPDSLMRLCIALRFSEARPGYEVFYSTLTFSASANQTVYKGARRDCPYKRCIPATFLIDVSVSLCCQGELGKSAMCVYLDDFEGGGKIAFPTAQRCSVFFALFHA